MGGSTIAYTPHETVCRGPPPRENTLMFTFPCNDITEHLCGVPAEKTLWSLTCCISKLSNPPKLYHVRAGQG